MQFVSVFLYGLSLLIISCVSASVIPENDIELELPITELSEGQESAQLCPKETTYFDKLPENCLISVLSFLDYTNVFNLLKNGKFLSIELENDPLRHFYEAVAQSFPLALNSRHFRQLFDMRIWENLKHINTFKAKLENANESEIVVYALCHIPDEEITNLMLEVPNNLVISNCDKIKDFIESHKEILIPKLAKVDEAILVSKAKLFRNYPQIYESVKFEMKLLKIVDLISKHSSTKLKWPEVEAILKNNAFTEEEISHYKFYCDKTKTSLSKLIPKTFASLEVFMKSTLKLPSNKFNEKFHNNMSQIVQLMKEIRSDYPDWYETVMDRVKKEIEKVINDAQNYIGLIVIAVLFDDEFVDNGAVKEPDFDLEIALKFIMTKYFNFNEDIFPLFYRIRNNLYGTNIYKAIYRIEYEQHRHDFIPKYYNDPDSDLGKLKIPMNVNELFIDVRGFIDLELIISSFKKYKQDFMSKIVDKSLLKSILKRVITGIYITFVDITRAKTMISSRSLRTYCQIYAISMEGQEQVARDVLNMFRDHDIIDPISNQEVEDLIERTVKFCNENLTKFNKLTFSTDFTFERHVKFLIEFFETFIEVYPEIRNESPENIQEFFFNLIGNDRTMETLFDDYFLYYITLATF